MRAILTRPIYYLTSIMMFSAATIMLTIIGLCGYPELVSAALASCMAMISCMWLFVMIIEKRYDNMFMLILSALIQLPTLPILIVIRLIHIFWRD